MAAWDGRSARVVEPPRSNLGGDEEIVDYVFRATRSGPAVVAIDCPLAVPNERGMRPCDRLVNEFFRRFQAGVYPANRRNLGRYGGLRGETIAAALAAQGFSLDPRSWARRRVIEVYPHAAMITLFGLQRTLKYKTRQHRGYSLRWRELAKLQARILGLRAASPRLRVDGDLLRRSPQGLRGAAFKELEDALDSLVCAYVGVLYGLEGLARCAVFGDRDRGHIVIPMTENLWRENGSPPADRGVFLPDESNRRSRDWNA